MGNNKAMVYSGRPRHSETFYGHNRILIKRGGMVIRADDEECISAAVEGMSTEEFKVELAKRSRAIGRMFPSSGRLFGVTT